MKTKVAVLNGKRNTGNRHFRFDEGEGALAKSRRGSLLNNEIKIIVIGFVVFCAVIVRAASGTEAYVHDGLLAIWDGIENSGKSRQHVVDITEWKDVVGDRAFALHGVKIENDSLYFDGKGSRDGTESPTRGVLLASDAASIFGAAANGTMEILFSSDDARDSQEQRVVLQGPSAGAVGLALGTTTYNYIFLQNSTQGTTVPYNWRGETNTFSIAYSGNVCSKVYCNGEVMAMNGTPDCCGSPDSCAYVGGRQRGDNGFIGKIYCIRLYNRHLSADEVATNARVDCARYRDRAWISVGAPKLVLARPLSAEFDVSAVNVSNDDYESQLSIAWGMDKKILDRTNYIAKVLCPCVCRAHLTRLEPVDYYVQAVLERLDGRGKVVDSRVSEVVCLPASSINNVYVQDGLVAWWDGIANTGSSRTFDDSLAVWKDVVGDVGFTVAGYTPSGTKDSMLFSDETACGRLSQIDTANTFGRCSNGTLEVVARGEDSTCVVVRGSNASGIGFGSTYSNGHLYFKIHAGVDNKKTVEGSWSTRQTFAVRYNLGEPQEVSIGGINQNLTSSVEDYLGPGGSDGTIAVLGGRMDGQQKMHGEICAIRLYSRCLTDEEIVYNSIVDDNRFRGLPKKHYGFEITGSPSEYGSVVPAYGNYVNLTNGQVIVCSSPAVVNEGGVKMSCEGWRIETNSVDDASVWLPCRTGRGTSCTYEHKSDVIARLVWRWRRRLGLALILR